MYERTNQFADCKVAKKSKEGWNQFEDYYQPVDVVGRQSFVDELQLRRLSHCESTKSEYLRCYKCELEWKQSIF